MAPLHVWYAPLEHESANVAHGDTEVLCDLLNGHEAWQLVSWSVWVKDGQAGGLRCHGRTVNP